MTDSVYNISMTFWSSGEYLGRYLKCFLLNQMLCSVWTLKKNHLRDWVERKKMARAFSKDSEWLMSKTDVFPLKVKKLGIFKLEWVAYILVESFVYSCRPSTRPPWVDGLCFPKPTFYSVRISLGKAPEGRYTYVVCVCFCVYLNSATERKQ